MGLELQIGGESLRLSAAPEILSVLRGRYGAFAHDPTARRAPRPPIDLRIRCEPGRFRPEYERPAQVVARAAEPDVIALGGPLRGRYCASSREGTIDGATGLGAVDALIRTALSVALPLDGALLLHGAALRDGEGNGVALCGASGSGKSTATAAFGGFSDELVVVRPSAAGLEVESTPYWAGRPLLCTRARIVSLERGGRAGCGRLRGGSIARVLARHVVRHVVLESVDRAIFEALAAVAGCGSVTLASCPEGEEYLPFLAGTIGLRREVA